MEPFLSVTGAAAPLPLDDVNTDQVIPSAWLKDLNADLAEGFLAYMRRAPDGTRNTGFVLERPQFARAPILVTGANFGCGSSREHAVWALRAFGVRCVIGASPAEFFRENCLKNGVLPVTLDAGDMQQLMAQVLQADGHTPFTVDLQACEIRGPGGFRLPFEIGAGERAALLEGLDDIGMTLKSLPAIEAWEARVARERPFVQAAIATLKPPPA
ncbi:MAG: 3-isopropylmalate dehydratase [Ramlibacter sp.]|nr:3-isopropylmalate dehydratase [Ramlibacter sp.]